MIASTEAVLVYDGRAFHFPWGEMVRPLNRQESERLRESIDRLGVIDPITVDEHDNVIDGKNRLEIAHSIGIPVNQIPFDVRVCLGEEEKRELAWQLNEARRQLSAEELSAARLDRINRVAEARREGQSLRAIAAKEGLSQTTIMNDLREVRANDPDFQEPSRVVGNDGRSHPSQHPSRLRLPSPPPPPDSVECVGMLPHGLVKLVIGGASFHLPVAAARLLHKQLGEILASATESES